LHEKFQYLFEPELINEICHNGQLRKYEADHIIMEIGTLITHMPLVIDGSIKVLTEDKEGHDLLLYYLELGDTCAITLNCCTRKSKSSIKAISEEATEVLFIPVEFLEDWMVKYKSWRAFVLDSYNARLDEMVQAIDNLVFNSLEERLIKYLRDKAWVTKTNIIKTSHYQIANDLHSGRVVISRLMKKLEKQGIIKQSRNTVEFLEFSKQS
jgi:CRP/FNR family transcriptional regulator